MRIDHYDLQGEVQYRQQQAQNRKVRNLGPVPPVVNPPEGNNAAVAGETQQHPDPHQRPDAANREAIGHQPASSNTSRPARSGRRQRAGWYSRRWTG